MKGSIQLWDKTCEFKIHVTETQKRGRSMYTQKSPKSMEIIVCLVEINKAALLVKRSVQIKQCTQQYPEEEGAPMEGKLNTMKMSSESQDGIRL